MDEFVMIAAGLGAGWLIGLVFGVWVGIELHHRRLRRAVRNAKPAGGEVDNPPMTPEALRDLTEAFEAHDREG